MPAPCRSPGRPFDSSYLQYVLHHLPGADAIAALLSECARVSATVVIVEEVRGPKTDIARARAFDRDTNAHLHPGVPMPVFGYLSADSVKAQLSAAGAPPVTQSVVSIGSDENGWLETHVFVGRARAARIEQAWTRSNRRADEPCRTCWNQKFLTDQTQKG